MCLPAGGAPARCAGCSGVLGGLAMFLGYSRRLAHGSEERRAGRTLCSCPHCPCAQQVGPDRVRHHAARPAARPPEPSPRREAAEYVIQRLQQLGLPLGQRLTWWAPQPLPWCWPRFKSPLPAEAASAAAQPNHLAAAVRLGCSDRTWGAPQRSASWAEHRPPPPPPRLAPPLHAPPAGCAAPRCPRCGRRWRRAAPGWAGTCRRCAPRCFPCCWSGTWRRAGAGRCGGAGGAGRGRAGRGRGGAAGRAGQPGQGGAGAVGAQHAELLD